MGLHEQPQRAAEVYYPQGHPLHKQPTPPAGEVKQPASRASAPDLGDIIRGIHDLAAELSGEFFAVPDISDEETGRVDPEKFDASTQQAFIACGNALDYAIRLVRERGSSARIMKLRKQLAEEMRAAGLTGDPLDGESPQDVGPSR
jgi:hypothetical protein